MGQSPQGFSPTQRSISNRGKLRGREVGPPQGKAHHLVAQCQMVSPEHIHTGNIVQIQQVLSGAICMCKDIHECNNS